MKEVLFWSLLEPHEDAGWEIQPSVERKRDFSSSFTCYYVINVCATAVRKTPTGCVWKCECSERIIYLSHSWTTAYCRLAWSSDHSPKNFLYTNLFRSSLPSLFLCLGWHMFQPHLPLSQVEGLVLPVHLFLTEKKRDGGGVLEEWQQCHPLVGFDI